MQSIIFVQVFVHQQSLSMNLIGGWANLKENNLVEQVACLVGVSHPLHKLCFDAMAGKAFTLMLSGAQFKSVDET